MRPFIALLFCLISTLLISQENNLNPDVLNDLADDGIASVIITCASQASLIEITQTWTKSDKANFVFEYLQDQSEREQKELTTYLENNKISYQSFWIVNAVKAKLSLEQIQHIFLHFSVESITSDQDIKVSAHREETSEEIRMDPEWGIQMIQADKVWDLGYRGDGVVVAGQDTGYDFDNPLIIEKYRGNGFVMDHNYNWHDAIREINPLHQDSIIDETTNPCGLNLVEPCDDHGHGSHTMGTMVGEDNENKIGVAPDSKWIACRNMERGYGTPSTYLECFEFFLAPTDLNGENPNPDLAPHVINNSWGCPEMEGCNPDNWHILDEAVNNLVAAGTVVVVSAGNSGSSNCGSIQNPASFFENSFTIGATRENDSITGFSSIGPVTVDGSLRMKPDVVAPGQNVRSIHLNDEFRSLSGTSMAGPHVAGVVALMISANPSLAGQVSIITEILKETAVQKTWDLECEGMLSDQVPNFVYGHGRINALAAVEAGLSYVYTEEQNAQTQIKVFPNPANDLVQIQSSKHLGQIELYTALGKLVLTKDLDGFIDNINVAGLVSGPYYYKVTSIDNTKFSGSLIRK